jgi:hypothetical protein
MRRMAQESACPRGTSACLLLAATMLLAAVDPVRGNSTYFETPAPFPPPSSSPNTTLGNSTYFETPAPFSPPSSSPNTTLGNSTYFETPAPFPPPSSSPNTTNTTRGNSTYFETPAPFPPPSSSPNTTGVWSPGSGVGVQCDMRLPPIDFEFPVAGYERCYERRFWWDLTDHFRNRSALTGGLGCLMTHVFEVFVCFRDHPCLHDLANRQHLGYTLQDNDYMCYVFNEVNEKWIPWGPNSKLIIFNNGSKSQEFP